MSEKCWKCSNKAPESRKKSNTLLIILICHHNLSFRLMRKIVLLILNKTRVFLVNCPRLEWGKRWKSQRQRNVWSWALVELSTWVVLGGGYFCKKYTCVFIELEVNFSEILTFTSLRVSICSTSGMNKQTLFSLNSSPNSGLWLGFDWGCLAKNPVHPCRRASAWSTAYNSLH